MDTCFSPKGLLHSNPSLLKLPLLLFHLFKLPLDDLFREEWRRTSPTAIRLLCLQHSSSTKLLQSNQPFEKQVSIFNNTLLQNRASQPPQWQHPSHPPAFYPLFLQAPWYSPFCYNSNHLRKCWSERWCYSVTWACTLSFKQITSPIDDASSFPTGSLVMKG